MSKCANSLQYPYMPLDKLLPVRAGVYLILFLIIVFDPWVGPLPEVGYVPGSCISPSPIIYEKLIVGAFRIVDLLVFLTFGFMLTYISVVLRQPVRFDSPLRRGIWLLEAALGVGIAREAIEILYDVPDSAMMFYVWKDLFVLGVLFFFVVRNAFTSLAQTRRLLECSAWLLWLKAIVILMFFISGRGVPVLGAPEPMIGTISGASAMSLFTMALAFYLSQAIFGLAPKMKSGLVLVLSMPLAMVVLFSFRRGPIIQLIVVLLITIMAGLRSGKTRLRPVIILSLLSIILGFLGAILRTGFHGIFIRFTQLIGELSNPQSLRMLDYVDWYHNMAKDPFNFIFGVGLQGISWTPLWNLQELGWAWLERGWSGIHNTFLDIWLRLGLLGAIAWLLFVDGFFKLVHTIACSRIRVVRQECPGLIGVGICGMAILLMSLFYGGPFDFQGSILLFLIAGLLVAALDIAELKNASPTRGNIKRCGKLAEGGLSSLLRGKC